MNTLTRFAWPVTMWQGGQNTALAVGVALVVGAFVPKDSMVGVVVLALALGIGLGVWF